MAERKCVNPPWNDGNNTPCLPSCLLKTVQSPAIGRDPKNWGREQTYNNRVLLDNWFEERRMYHQLCSRCTGHSLYRTDYSPICKQDYESVNESCLPPKKYYFLNFAEGEGWKLIRNTEDYCDYLSNYTTTYDLNYNWDVRRAACKHKPKRKWKPVRDNLWVPEQDNSLSYGNLTQLGFRKAPILPPVPNDWKTYSMATEHCDSYPPQKYPEAYTICRFATPKPIVREMEEYIQVNKPGTYSSPCDLIDCKANNACCRKSFPQNPKRFSRKCVISNLKSHPAKQALFVSRKDRYPQLKHPPQPYPFYSAPDFCERHSCTNNEACAMGKYVMDVAKCSGLTR